MSTVINTHPAPEASSSLIETVEDRLRRIRHIALDMDGTIYCGGTLFQFTKAFLERLSELGIGYTLLTNNSSKSVDDYVVGLRSHGIQVKPEQLCTSTQLSIQCLREMMPSVRRLFLLGTPSMAGEITGAGFALAVDSPDDEPDAVLVGFDTGLTFSRLCRAAYWIKLGKPFIASHMDRVCPTDERTVLVDCGSVCAALREATDRGPDVVLGKPDPRVLHGLLGQHGLTTEQLAMVGDRLYTDMRMAQRAGVLGVLVLTGEASAQEAAEHLPPLDLVVDDLKQLGELLKSVQNGNGK